MTRTEPTPVSRRLLPTLLPENEDTMPDRTGWHFHTIYRNEAWRDETCPDPRTAIPLSPTDERVLRALTHPGLRASRESGAA